MYTYLIGWSKLNKYYYGVRYAANSKPEDLWVKYFTSSKVVKSYRDKFGEPYIVEIRKTFATAKEAQLWEHRVLKKMLTSNRDIWLNATDNIAIHYKGNYSNTVPGSIASVLKTKGKTYEELYGPEKARELKLKKSLQSKQRWDTPDIREKMRKKPLDKSKYVAAAHKRWAQKKASVIAGNGG